jgi:putative acetyltransferase
VHIRTELPADIPAIRAVNLAAFETSSEADLVEALRTQADPLISLVAVTDDTAVGHILFSPVTLAGHEDLAMMGLAPMAVLPARQRQGVGSALIREGLDRCRQQGIHAVIVLGHADYYPRFGFVPASRFGLRSEYDVPDDVFMAIELADGALQGRSGLARYHPAFASL